MKGFTKWLSNKRELWFGFTEEPSGLPRYSIDPPQPAPVTLAEHFESSSPCGLCSDYNRWLQGHKRFRVISTTAWKDSGHSNKHYLIVTYER